jgi:hypothetical protein
MRTFLMLVVPLLAIASCGSTGPTGLPEGNAATGTVSDGGASSTGSHSTPGTFGDASSTACSPNEACWCTQPGTTQSCWTGPAADRNVGACHDGTQTCVAMGELAEWGPCEGQQLDCGVMDAAVAEASLPPVTPPDASPGACGQTVCACVPGVVIDCDEDCGAGVYCSDSAQKSCLPDGTWGPCHEVTTMQPSTCKEVGGGCTSSPSCGSGSGFFLGDCGYAFTCTIGGDNSGGASASGDNGVWTVMCSCQNGPVSSSSGGL